MYLSLEQEMNLSSDSDLRSILIHVTGFESDANKWVVKESIKYFNEYKDLPTLTVFKIKVDEVDDELLPLKVEKE